MTTAPVFLGGYRIETRLGYGGMGEVFLARDEALDRRVAIKRIRSDKDVTAEERRRFRREARAVARLNHPAIVGIHAILKIEEGDCIVMEYVDGRDLRELVESGELDDRRMLEIAAQIVAGLAEAHDHGLVHRDLKLDNVRLDRKGQAKILDFGLARFAGTSSVETDSAESASVNSSDNLTADGEVIGTVYAMSPEQAQGQPVDHRSDLFSLGVLLYEMLSGRRPFTGGNHLAMLWSIIMDPHEPLSEHRPDLEKPIVELVDALLCKDPEDRPQEARQVAQVLADLLAETSRRGLQGRVSQAVVSQPISPTVPLDSIKPVELKRHPPPDLPREPYPVLLPYTHPALLAGRERETARLMRLLREPVPIVLLSAASGTGKSSLLLGALVPELRAQGRPTALTRFPHEPRLGARLVEDLLTDGKTPTQEDFETFVQCLEETRRVAGLPPVLVLDQFEEILRSETTRAQVGLLLSASLRRGAEGIGSLCYWVLAVRMEHQGAVQQWLRDVLFEAQAEETSRLDGLPYDLSGPERTTIMLLPPLAKIPSGPGALTAAQKVFQEAIERPLELRDQGGEPLYGIRFAENHAERLARAFAESRLANPRAPLGPELQVVLAHLLARSREGTIEVPEDPGSLIETALADHLRRSLDIAFTDEDRVGRARAILALRELVTAEGERGEGLPEETLVAAIGRRGAEILEKLSSPLTRLVIAVESPEGLRYVLSHECLAELVLRVVEEEGHEVDLLVDRDLLAARRVVALKSTLFAADGGRVSSRLSRRHFRRVAEHPQALLCDEERRAWWRACKQRRLMDRVRWVSWSTAVMVFLLMVGVLVGRTVEERAERRHLTGQVVLGEASSAFAALMRLREQGVADEALSTLLREREKPSVVLEEGLGGLDGELRSRAVLDTARLLLPLVEENPEDFVLIANMVWALDYGPGRDPAFVEQARELRELVLRPLRELRPPPPLFDESEPSESESFAEESDWIEIPAGSFWMGTADDEEGSVFERPRHEVTVSAFRLQRHEVTTGQMRHLVPDYAKADETDLPARFVDWYTATTYAAWLGGRLPTEAEWEYAARAGCAFSYCDREGRETTLDAVAWTLRNASKDAEIAEPTLHPVMRLEPNPWGLYDMLGNVWEWTGDWSGRYSPTKKVDPWGAAAAAPDGDWRVIRGGSFWYAPPRARPAYRNWYPPEISNEDLGFRVALPPDLPEQ